MMKTVISTAALLAAATLAPVHAATVYSNNFDAPATVAAGVSDSFNAGGGFTTATIGAYNATYGNIFRNQTVSPIQATELTLSNLGSHTSLSLGLVLAFLDSWDSTNGSPAPDNVDLYIDNVLIGSYTYNNASGSVQAIGAGSVLAQFVQFDANQFFSDTVVDLSGDPALTVAHTASSVTVKLVASGSGWQGGVDEAWGIDNLTVSLAGTANNVPEPGSLALLALAGAAGLVTRRRTR